MDDMIFPLMGTILYYCVIVFGILNRYQISEWAGSFAGGDLLVGGVTYLICILIVSLWCRMKPFNIFMSGLTKD